MSKLTDSASEPRRGTAAEEEAYLKLVGERVRLERVRRSMSRKTLSQTSGVSERYLAELERGTGNASLLVLRQIAEAVSLRVADLASEHADRSIDLQLAIHQLERLGPQDISEARRMLSARFGRSSATPKGRIALIGLRGAGKSTIGQEAAKALSIPFVELDREIERVSGMELTEIFAVHGHAVYRRVEHECLQSVIEAYNRVVIATGGGIVTAPDTFELLLSSCYTVWLKASPNSHIDRATKGGELRANTLGRHAMAEFNSILESRTPLYAKADCEIDTTDKTSEQVLGELIDLVTRQNEPASIAEA